MKTNRLNTTCTSPACSQKAGHLCTWCTTQWQPMEIGLCVSNAIVASYQLLRWGRLDGKPRVSHKLWSTYLVCDATTNGGYPVGICGVDTVWFVCRRFRFLRSIFIDTRSSGIRRPRFRPSTVFLIVRSFSQSVSHFLLSTRTQTSCIKITVIRCCALTGSCFKNTRVISPNTISLQRHPTQQTITNPCPPSLSLPSSTPALPLPPTILTNPRPSKIPMKSSFANTILAIQLLRGTMIKKGRVCGMIWIGTESIPRLFLRLF